MEVKYLVTQGNVDLYDTNLEAFINTKDCSQNSILPIPLCNKSLDTCLFKALKPYIESGRTLDMKLLETVFQSSDKFKQILRLYNRSKFCIAYINRIIKGDGSSQYGILIENNNRLYLHLSAIVANRGTNTDIAPFQKLRELSNLYDFRGKVRIMFPPPTVRCWDYQGRWEVEQLKPIELPFEMMNLNQILSGKESIVPVEII